MSVTKEGNYKAQLEELAGLLENKKVRRICLPKVQNVLGDLIRQAQAVIKLQSNDHMSSMNVDNEVAPNQKLECQWRPDIGKLHKTKREAAKRKNKLPYPTFEKTFSIVSKLKGEHVEESEDATMQLSTQIEQEDYIAFPLNRQYSGKVFTISCHYITAIDLLSIDTYLPLETINEIKKCDPRFVVGWLDDEVINGFIFLIAKQCKDLVYCSSGEALLAEKKMSLRKMWVLENLSCINRILIPYNANGSHWILIAISVIDKKLCILDPLHQKVQPSESSYKKAMTIASHILKSKFDIDDFTVVNLDHSLQSDSVSCGVLVCYYAEQLSKGTFQGLLHFLI